MSNISWKEIKNKISFEQGYVIAMFTDKFVVSNYPLDEENENLFNLYFDKYILDCRIFNKEKEYRFFRGNIGKDLKQRETDDLKKEYEDYFDRSYYLDIDTTKGKGADGKVTATGGGCYYLPSENINDIKITIREYVKYDELGTARVYDWRLVDFTEDK